MRSFALLQLMVLLGCSAQTTTTNWGKPVDNLRDSLTVGQRGPTLLQDTLLLERLQTQNRERIPERVVHARGAVAKGTFTVTSNLQDITIANFLATNGKQTPIAVRFSTVTHGRDSPEFDRDPRGFAVKFYTEQGNYDLVGNTWPVFFIRDGIRFPEMVRAMKPDPVTGIVQWWRRYDFLANYPESCHALTFLLDDAGIPANYRHVNGFGIHTFKMVDAAGNETFIRWQYHSHLGEVFLMDDEAILQHFSEQSTDLFDAIARGDYPRYTMYIQTYDPSTQGDLLRNLTFDILDPTKEWPVDLFPLREVGVLELNENPISKFLENDMIAFSPGRMVPGIEPSDDKLLQARLFSYPDAHRYRLGTNNMLLPINMPKNGYYENHVDGAMNFLSDGYASQRVNYFPSFISKVEEANPYPQHSEVLPASTKVRESIPEVEDDYAQAGDRYRSWPADRQERFAERVGITMSEPEMDDTVTEIWLEIWGRVDAGLPEKIESYMTLYAAENLAKNAALQRKKRMFAMTSGSHW